MRKRNLTIFISLGTIIFIGSLSLVLFFSLRKDEKVIDFEKNGKSSVSSQNKKDIDFNYIKEDFNFIKENHYIEPIFPELTNDYVYKSFATEKGVTTIANFISRKTEKYLEKYSKFIFNKYKEKSLNGKFIDKIYDKKYFVSRLKFVNNLDVFGTDYNVIIDFKEFFNEARDIDWFFWSTINKRNTKKDQEYYMKNVNTWRYQNENDILKKIYG